jgi:hypothetical protein
LSAPIGFILLRPTFDGCGGRGDFQHTREESGSTDRSGSLGKRRFGDRV